MADGDESICNRNEPSGRTSAVSDSAVSANASSGARRRYIRLNMGWPGCLAGVSETACVEHGTPQILVELQFGELHIGGHATEQVVHAIARRQHAFVK